MRPLRHLARVWSCHLLLLLSGFFRAGATVPEGPALDIRFLRPPPEPVGPSSRRSGVVISEIMYHPAKREGVVGPQYVEIHNSLPWFEDLGGWVLDGAVRYRFPSNHVIPAGGYVVIATDPGSLRAIGLTNVLGPFENNRSLPKDSGKLRLLNARGAVNFEVEYQDSEPWPVAADGGGHSLVLARPSHGEHDVRAWDASSRIGGSPGAPEPPRDAAGLSLFINEVLTRPLPGTAAFVELFNYSDQPLDISRFVLTDDGDQNKYRLPKATILGPRGFLRVTDATLNFNLAPDGEKLFLKNAADTVVLDAVRFPPSREGSSWGRYPDGGREFSGLPVPTPGAMNAAPALPEVVIHEIHYHPPSADEWEEFIELHNPGPKAVDVGGWRLEGGVRIEFPPGTSILAGSWLVVAKDAVRLRSVHPELVPGTIVGDFEGNLSNHGERIRLVRPEILADAKGVFTIAYVAVDEVTYNVGGRWGSWSDGGGSSLERVSARSRSDRAGTWADSDESRKSEWMTVESTGRLEMGNSSAPADALEILLFGKGECLIDNLEVMGPGGTNRLANGTFETGTNGWSFQGTHAYATLATNLGVDGSVGLRLRTTGPGHTGPNRLRAAIRPTLAAGQTATLRARARWLAGTGQILLRLHGNWLEASSDLHRVNAHGTPGRENTRHVGNPPPVISDVQHHPVLPRTNETALVVARVDHPDGLDRVLLLWHRDTTNQWTTNVMSSRGAGWFAGEIPPQPAGTMIAFHIEADDALNKSGSATFPKPFAGRECLIRWEEPSVAGGLGVYRLWTTKTNTDRWTRREKLSNDPVDGTFVCGDYRVIYNAAGMYSGSPYHQAGMVSPTSGSCDYLFTMPPDERFLGEEEIIVLKPGNAGNDPTLQREAHSYWMARELGLPFCNRRPVQVVVNGVRRGFYDDSQQPGRDMVDQWFPDGGDGDLHKIQLWFEFSLNGAEFQATGANLASFTTTGGAKKLSRYRWNWPRRAFGDAPHNYTNLFRLVDAANTSGTSDAYIQAIQREVDVDQWFRTHAVEHIVNNSDSFSCGGGQNMYAFRPDNGRWNLMIWDIDFAFTVNTDSKADLVTIGGKDHGPVNTIPVFRRMYWQALLEAANGPLLADRANAILDARYRAFLSNSVPAQSPATTKTFIRNRRQYILDQAARLDRPFRIQTNDGEDISTIDAVLVLSGAAPIAVRTLTLNGQPIDVSWSSVSNWTARITLTPGDSRFVFGGLNSLGQPLDTKLGTIQVHYDPNAPVPVPNLLDHALAADTVTLTWRSQPGRRYRVLQAAQPSGIWRQLGSNVTATDFKTRVTYSTDLPARFYRIQWIP